MPPDTVPPSASPPTSGTDNLFRAPAPPRADPSSAWLRTALAKGAKDLLVEIDRGRPRPVSYAVAPVGALADGGAIALRVKLRHD